MALDRTAGDQVGGIYPVIQGKYSPTAESVPAIWDDRVMAVDRTPAGTPKRKLAALVIVALGAFGALFAAPPSFAAVTIGSDLSSDGNPDSCLQPCTETVLQTVLPGRPTTAPNDGVVTRWSVRSMSGSIQLRVLRPAAGNQFQDVGSSGPTNSGGAGVQTFSTRLAIKAGDSIGIDALEGAFLAFRDPVPGAITGLLPRTAARRSHGCSPRVRFRTPS